MHEPQSRLLRTSQQRNTSGHRSSSSEMARHAGTLESRLQRIERQKNASVDDLVQQKHRRDDQRRVVDCDTSVGAIFIQTERIEVSQAKDSCYDYRQGSREKPRTKFADTQAAIIRGTEQPLHVDLSMFYKA